MSMPVKEELGLGLTVAVPEVKNTIKDRFQAISGGVAPLKDRFKSFVKTVAQETAKAPIRAALAPVDTVRQVMGEDPLERTELPFVGSFATPARNYLEKEREYGSTPLGRAAAFTGAVGEGVGDVAASLGLFNIGKRASQEIGKLIANPPFRKEILNHVSSANQVLGEMHAQEMVGKGVYDLRGVLQQMKQNIVLGLQHDGLDDAAQAVSKINSVGFETPRALGKAAIETAMKVFKESIKTAALKAPAIGASIPGATAAMDSLRSGEKEDVFGTHEALAPETPPKLPSLTGESFQLAEDQFKSDWPNKDPKTGTQYMRNKPCEDASGVAGGGMQWLNGKAVCVGTWVLNDKGEKVAPQETMIAPIHQTDFGRNQTISAELSQGDPLQSRTTFYAPGSGGQIEGPWATSKPNLEGEVNENGDPIPRTLDDIRLGKSNYVTLASDPSNYGKFVNMGDVTYKSPIDGKEYTLKNVVGYVHDTGSAFTGRPDKFDVAVGDFRGWTASQASSFVDAQPYGRNIVHPWTALSSSRESIVASLGKGGVSSSEPLLAAFEPAQIASIHQTGFGRTSTTKIETASLPSTPAAPVKTPVNTEKLGSQVKTLKQTLSSMESAGKAAKEAQTLDAAKTAMAKADTFVKAATGFMSDPELSQDIKDSLKESLDKLQAAKKTAMDTINKLSNISIFDAGKVPGLISKLQKAATSVGSYGRAILKDAQDALKPTVEGIASKVSVPTKISLGETPVGIPPILRTDVGRTNLPTAPVRTATEIPPILQSNYGRTSIPVSASSGQKGPYLTDIFKFGPPQPTSESTLARVPITTLKPVPPTEIPVSKEVLEQVRQVAPTFLSEVKPTLIKAAKPVLTALRPLAPELKVLTTQDLPTLSGNPILKNAADKAIRALPFAEIAKGELQDINYRSMRLNRAIPGGQVAGIFVKEGQEIYNVAQVLLGPIIAAFIASKLKGIDRPNIEISPTLTTPLQEVLGHEMLHRIYELHPLGKGFSPYDANKGDAFVEDFNAKWLKLAATNPLIRDIEKVIQTTYADENLYDKTNERFAYLGNEALAGGYGVLPKELQPYYLNVISDIDEVTVPKPPGKPYITPGRKYLTVPEVESEAWQTQKVPPEDRETLSAAQQTAPTQFPTTSPFDVRTVDPGPWLSNPTQANMDQFIRELIRAENGGNPESVPF